MKTAKTAKLIAICNNLIVMYDDKQITLTELRDSIDLNCSDYNVLSINILHLLNPIKF